MKLIYPDPDNLHIVDQDCVTTELDASGYSAVYIVYGVDARGVEWQWFEYHTYTFETDEWLPVDVRGMERVS